MKAFNLDFKILIVLWLPTFLRIPFVIGFAVVLITPLISLYNLFLKARKENLIRVSTTCQKFSMQKRLNDLFDKRDRRIKIIKAIQYEGLYLYTEAEDDFTHSKTKWLRGDKPIYLRNESELYSNLDFIVKFLISMLICLN